VQSTSYVNEGMKHCQMPILMRPIDTMES
jgi:hypothetical protein